MVARGLAAPAAHAARTLDLLHAAGRIDPAQEPEIILATAKWYRQLRDRGYAPDDVLAAMDATAADDNAAMPAYADVEEIVF